ncbi:MAG: hypothetical protein F7B18_06175 [Desulfurococcales archaeon]|nr:hypothetical protein [Desulfurococcales archaeon]
MPEASSLELLGNIAEAAAGDPVLAGVIVVNFLVGAALGYLAVRIAKYLIAAVGLMAATLALNVWAYGRSVDELSTLKKIAIETGVEVKDALVEAAKVLGLMTLSPFTLGFIIGLVIGATRS